ncbi:hypothetical protein E8E13_008365 [Curvularia kusanoi]|uniref:Uncharacterized protein n=1 Tax=Curvularia kusanoi TaxID=90978 RepID=A0A9P4TBR9_CURKU|nr:hypothetical protein E8E13_008365 [Curvularia kusanoi]
MHMNGIANIFQHRFALQDPSDESRELAVLIGALDLPTHILGRQTKHLYMWQQHCTGQGGIEEITGIPCSLLDLFASPLDDDIEQRLLRWSGEPGEPVMCKTWEATQWAGLIRIRDIRMEHGLPINAVENTTRSVVQHILALMRDLRIRLDVNIFATTDMFFFPLVAIGSQPQYLSADNRMFIRDGISALANSSTASYPYYEAVLKLLEIQWAQGGTKSIDTIAKEMGLELGLY